MDGRMDEGMRGRGVMINDGTPSLSTPASETYSQSGIKTPTQCVSGERFSSLTPL